MKLRTILAQRRFKKALINKFSRTYKFISTMLQKRGFQMPNNPAESPIDCFRGRKGLFLSSEKVGPGIVGTLLCCAQCRGYGQIQDYFTKSKKLPEITLIHCILDSNNSDGVYRPVILSPMLKKPNNKPFVYEIPHIQTIIENWVLPKETKK